MIFLSVAENVGSHALPVLVTGSADLRDRDQSTQRDLLGIFLKRTNELQSILLVLRGELRKELRGLANNLHTFDLLIDRKSTRLNSSHIPLSRMPSSA